MNDVCGFAQGFVGGCGEGRIRGKGWERCAGGRGDGDGGRLERNGGRLGVGGRRKDELSGYKSRERLCVRVPFALRPFQQVTCRSNWGLDVLHQFLALNLFHWSRLPR